MAIFKPFRALRPDKKYAEVTLCPPYDVVTQNEAASISAASHYSFMNVIRADGSMPQADQYSDEVYEASKNVLMRLEDEGIFRQDKSPSYYIYSQTMNGRTQTGIVGCASIDDYENGIIKKHEVTREEKERDRIRHFDTCNANTEPVFLIYKNNRKTQDLTDSIINSAEPEYDATDSSGVRHQLWAVSDSKITAQYEELFSEMPALYIADGHHRTASAVKVGRKRRNENPGYDGSEEFNHFMAAAFPDNHLKVLDYNRLIKDLNGMLPEEFLEKLSHICIITPEASTDILPQKKHTCTMYIADRWYTLTFKPDIVNGNNPVDALDVSILQKYILNPLLGITDPRTDSRISFAGGIKGPEELRRRVDNGDMAVAFALYPVSIQEIMDIADAGLVMPPKSTWFEPKLGSGWFVHKL